MGVHRTKRAAQKAAGKGGRVRKVTRYVSVKKTSRKRKKTSKRRRKRRR